MIDKGISLKKINKMGIMTMQNCLRLHFDSIKLYKLKSYPSSYFLSILALEELGKFYILTDIIYHNNCGELAKKDIGEYIKIIYNHKIKQETFIVHTDTGLSQSFYNDIHNKNLDIKKQNACYVGLPKENGKIKLSGMIIQPLSIKSKEAKEQISLLNEELKLIINGVILNYAYLEIDIEKIMNTSLLKKLIKNRRFKNNHKIDFHKHIMRQLKKEGKI